MHSIRLRGPWRYEVLEHLAGEDSVPTTGKQKMPGDWSEPLGADFRGTVRYRRTFHMPTGLEEGQQVWLAIDCVDSNATVTLNSTSLGSLALNTETGESWRHEIQDSLLPTSELIIDVTHPAQAPGPGGLTGEVRLEIQTVKPRPVD